MSAQNSKAQRLEGRDHLPLPPGGFGRGTLRYAGDALRAYVATVFSDDQPNEIVLKFYPRENMIEISATWPEEEEGNG
jgi:hypothetical protein